MKTFIQKNQISIYFIATLIIGWFPWYTGQGSLIIAAPSLAAILNKVYAFKSNFALAPEEMAVGYAHLATAAEFNNVTGVYFDEKMKAVNPGKYAQNFQNIEKVMKMTRSYLRHNSD